MTEREVLKLALEAFEWNYNTDLDNIPACEQWAKMLKENITAIRETLSQPEYNTTSYPCLMENAQGELERIKLVQTGVGIGKRAEEAYKAAKERGWVGVSEEIAQPEQEPMAWMDGYRNIYSLEEKAAGCEEAVIPLYTTPPQRKPLTDEEIILIVADCASSHQHTDIHFARAIEAAHGIKENK